MCNDALDVRLDGLIWPNYARSRTDSMDQPFVDHIGSYVNWCDLFLDSKHSHVFKNALDLRTIGLIFPNHVQPRRGSLN